MCWTSGAECDLHVAVSYNPVISEHTTAREFTAVQQQQQQDRKFKSLPTSQQQRRGAAIYTWHSRAAGGSFLIIFLDVTLNSCVSSPACLIITCTCHARCSSSAQPRPVLSPSRLGHGLASYESSVLTVRERETGLQGLAGRTDDVHVLVELHRLQRRDDAADWCSGGQRRRLRWAAAAQVLRRCYLSV